jgi:O-antigen ligase
LVLGNVIPGAEITNVARFSGLTGHVSDLGGIASVGGAVSVALISMSGKRWLKPAAVSVFMACCLGLVLSGSVSGMIALLVAVASLLVRRTVSIRSLAVLVSVAAVALAYLTARQTSLGALTPLERLMQVTGSTATRTDLDTAGLRRDLAQQAWEGIQRNPFWGYGEAAGDNTLLPGRDYTVHNIELAAWYAGGMLTVAALLLMISVAVLYCWSRRDFDPWREGIVAAFASSLAFAQTAPSFYNRYFWLPIAFLIVFEIVSRRGNSERSGVWPVAAESIRCY